MNSKITELLAMCLDVSGCLEPKPHSPHRPTAFFEGRQWKASRLIWTLLNGPIPDNHFVCHRCDNVRCINPAHLFVGTQSDNMRDAVAKKRTARQKRTHCPNGHTRTLENIGRRKNGNAYCRICGGIKSRIWRDTTGKTKFINSSKYNGVIKRVGGE